MAITKAGESKSSKQEKWVREFLGEPVTVVGDGTHDYRFSISRSKTDDEATAKQFKLEKGVFGQWKLTIEQSADGERFQQVGRVPPGALIAFLDDAAEAIRATLTEDGATYDGKGNWQPAPPKPAAKPSKPTKKKG